MLLMGQFQEIRTYSHSELLYGLRPFSQGISNIQFSQAEHDVAYNPTSERQIV